MACQDKLWFFYPISLRPLTWSKCPCKQKIVSSTIDLTCCVLFTDTKSVWYEELTSQQIARRWRQCNTRSPPYFANTEDEDEWRTYILELLAKAHTLGGVNALSFEVTNTNYSDIAFSLECTSFSWRWETCFVGHKCSADIISKQLVLPLISTNHLLFTSAEPIQDMADVEVEEAVDKIGRTARRSVDTHVKNALSKPRISTILRRTTATFNSLHELPSITSSVEEPILQVPSLASSKSRSNDFTLARPQHDYLVSRDVEMSEPPPRSRSPMRISPPSQQTSKLSPSPTKADSATEESSADEGETSNSLVQVQSQRDYKVMPRLSVSPKAIIGSSKARSRSPLVQSSRAASARAKTPEQVAEQVDDITDDSSPIKPPPKKARATQGSSSEDDSESERRARVAQLKANSAGSVMAGAARRGVRQPIKRGGKRF